MMLGEQENKHFLKKKGSMQWQRTIKMNNNVLENADFIKVKDEIDLSINKIMHCLFTIQVLFQEVMVNT